MQAARGAFEELIRQPADEHVLVVISDGQPVGPNADEEPASSVVSQIKNRVHLIGLGLEGIHSMLSSIIPMQKVKFLFQISLKRLVWSCRRF